MANKSNTTDQIISIPQGGGALKGIGETFSPDLHTGTGNFTVPISLPPGRNGFQPQLDLVYSTGNGNGPYGLGWSLSIPGVSRKTSKGIPLYQNNPTSQKEADIFILSGAEDLVPVAETEGLTRYRPRTEGLFARIERYLSPDTDHWKVWSKDGLVSFYGTPSNVPNDPAVVANPENRAQIFSWKLTKTEDPFGNIIQYEYERDSEEAVDHHWDQIYLKRVQYADYTTSEDLAEKKFLISATFIYEERPDAFSDHRAGFEIRTRRRCTTIEIRTHADRERLVRVYKLIYMDQRGLPPEQLPLNGVSLLSQVQVEGHDDETGDLEKLPPLEFGYTAFEPTKRQYQPFNGSRPERSLGHPEFELVDLFGNGLPTVIEVNEQVRYWRNCGRGEFDFVRTMETAPAGVRLSDPSVQLLDANGNGRADLMVVEGVRNGYYPLTFDGEWNRQGFVRYQSVPTVNLDSPDVRLLDLDGNGVTDALRTGPHFELYYNDPENGWSELELRVRNNSSDFPNVSFEDPRIKLGDMTGDGLQDILRIHNGSIEYWPYRGYGRWGRCVTMRNNPRYEDATYFPGVGFDPKRLLVGDVDGDGVADLVYVSSGHITVWINQDGDSWSDPIIIHGTPPVTDATAVRLADMLGNGTEGILWTYDFGSFPDSTYKFLDLTGGIKPYVLDQMDNHMGAVTKVGYAPSTRFYLEDEERPETRWRTPLPFPVQVVARVEVIDHFSQAKLTTEYRYHHGYWDGVEHEFRGFGMVDQFDTEAFTEYNRIGLHGEPFEFEKFTKENQRQQFFSPPTLTRTWFHQGPVDDETGDWQELDWSVDYWSGDAQALRNTEAVNGFLQMLEQPRHKRDALRTLRGSILRTELYALDGTDRENRPYTVTENAYGLREIAVPDTGDSERQRIFFPHSTAQRTTQWERGDQPMTQFAFTGKYDEYGQPLRQVNIAVPRFRDYRTSAPAGEPYLGTITETQYAQRDDTEKYIVNRTAASTSYEIHNDGSQSIYDLYQSVINGTESRQMFGQTFNYYDGEAFVGLPFGQLGEFGAVVRTESLVLTEEILQEAYQDPTDLNPSDLPPYLRPESVASWPEEYPKEFRENMPELAGYRFADGSDHRTRGYFAETTRVGFDFHLAELNLPRRGLPVDMLDPFDSKTTITYDDPYHFLPTRVMDPVGLTIQAVYDRRVMQPSAVTDANGNQSHFVFSPLGLLKETWLKGKRDVEGDQERPGSRMEYDFLAYHESPPDDRQPVFVNTIRYEHHDTEIDVPLSERNAIIETREYSDGSGRLLQTRTQAEDVLFGDTTFGGAILPIDQSSLSIDAVGRRRADSASPNVIVSGWLLYDNKGRTIEKHEPFFDADWSYKKPNNEQMGQKVTMFYDPRGQVIRTLNPDGSEQRVIYGVPVDLMNPDKLEPTPWEAFTYDANDLAPLCVRPDGTSLKDAAPEFHNFTPSNIVIDALGRTVLVISRNRYKPENLGDPPLPIQEITTQTTYDIRGNVIEVIDALKRPAFRYKYDFANRPWRTESIDAGVRRIILNVAGNEIERRDSKEALLLHTYDVLQRPIRLWARDGVAGKITLRQRLEYGDAGKLDQPIAERQSMQAKNLLGQLHRHYDETGLFVIDEIDFKGNVLDKSRRVIADEPILAVFQGASSHAWEITPFQIDWKPQPSQTPADLESDLLDGKKYQTTTKYDALNRIKQLQFPEDVEGRRCELRLTYNRAGGLEQVWLDGAMYVERIAYDAKGQRTLIAYGNSLMTRYSYDPHTLRLKRLRSEHYSKLDDLIYHPNGEPLQDFAYDYDLVGNIQLILDRTPGSGIISNPDALDRRFNYDAIYRLRSATGRECNLPPIGPAWEDEPRCSDLTRARAYTEQYDYDVVGNILVMKHHHNSGGFTRDFNLEATSNRLQKVQIGDDPYAYKHDNNGNLLVEGTSRCFAWDHADQLKVFRTQTEGAEPSVYAHYLYDASGQRVKKLVRKQGGRLEVTHYIDGIFEHHHWRHGTENGENNHVHVIDNHQRFSIVRIGNAHPNDGGPARQLYLRDYLGSSSVVIDLEGTWINREEFTPYGETSFGSFARKRYRFAGKERDEETKLNYHGARYYAPWVLRWISCDPVGTIGGINLYSYAWGSPLGLSDPTGTQPDKENGPNVHANSDNKPMSKKQSRKEGNKGAARVRREQGMTDPDVQAGHTRTARHAPESGISPQEMNDPESFQHLHSRKGKGLDVTVKDQQGVEKTTTRHRAQDYDLIDPAVEQAKKANGGKLTREAQIEQGDYTKWRTENVPLDQRDIDALRAKGPAAPDKGPAVDPKTGRVIVSKSSGPVRPSDPWAKPSGGGSGQVPNPSKAGPALRNAMLRGLSWASEVLMVAQAGDEGSALGATVLVGACRMGPHACAYVGTLVLMGVAGNYRGEMIQQIQARYSDPETADRIIRMSVGYGTAADRQ